MDGGRRFTRRQVTRSGLPPGCSVHLVTLDDLDAFAEAVLASASELGLRLFILDGELGAGKTEFVRRACALLGVPAGDVRSPSFTIVNEYHTRSGALVVHADLYRLLDLPSELETTGLEEYISSPLAEAIFVEWPAPLMPEWCMEAVLLEFSFPDEGAGESRTVRVFLPAPAQESTRRDNR